MIKRIGMILGGGILLFMVLFGWWLFSRPETRHDGLGQHAFSLVRSQRQDRRRQSFKDPKVQGVVCHIARAKTGGVKGELGLAEDTSDASISCSQVGPIKIIAELKDGESIFDEHRSLMFKKLQVLYASSTGRTRCWFTWRIAIGLSRVAPRTASARCRSGGGWHHRYGPGVAEP